MKLPPQRLELAIQRLDGLVKESPACDEARAYIAGADGDISSPREP